MYYSHALRFIALLLFVAWNLESEGSETPSNLEISTFAELRVVRDGVSDFVPADRVRVGDEIFYTLRVRNAGDQPISEPKIIKLIPRNTRYVPGSAAGPSATVSFSTDGGKTFGPPESLIMNFVDKSARPATAADYTHIRWQLRHPLAPGATALLRFRCVLR
jgi:uncharacterized repeat protein (TIGR01451 family)